VRADRPQGPGLGGEIQFRIGPGQVRALRRDAPQGPKQHQQNRRGRAANLTGLVLANQVHNAIEASPAGARVEVAALAGKDTVIFRVEDRGGGLRPEVRAALFEPVASSKPRGTGVGLAISRRLARHAGGDVSLERTGPGGTVFRVTVPSWSGVLPA
ncbi:MAG: ATP-binding protein, partial [Opitutaceae bacterium]